MFEPGQSGNPKGRPKKGHALTDLLKSRLDRLGTDGLSAREVIIDKLVAMASEGDLDSIKVIFDRVEGKVTDPEPANALAGKVLEFLVKERNAANP